MRKWLAILIVLLLLLLVAAPGGMGLVAEKRIKTLAETWPTNSALTVQVLDYQRGWFKSTMKLAVGLKNQVNGHPIKIEIDETVVHGPIILDFTNHFVGIGQAYAAGELSIPEDQQAFFKQYIDQTRLLNNTIFLHLFGAVTVGITAPELSITQPNTPGVRLTLEGFSSLTKFSPKMTRVASHSLIQQIIWQDADSTLTVNKISGRSNLGQTKEGLWLGDIDFAVDSAGFTTANKLLISLQNAEYTSESREKNGLISGESHFNLDAIKIKDTSYGPAELGVNVTNINAEPLAQLKRLSQALQTQNGVAALQQGSIDRQKLIFKIIARGMQLNVAPLSVETPNGTISGNLNIVLPNLIDQANGKKITKHFRVSIPMLIGGLKSALQLSVPKTIVESSLESSIVRNMQAMGNSLGMDTSNVQALATAAKQRAAAQLQSWVASGLLIDSGENYQFAATYESGKLLVNGKPLLNPALGAVAQGISSPLSATTAPAVNVQVAPAANNSSAPAGVTIKATTPAANGGSAPASVTIQAPAPAASGGSAPASVTIQATPPAANNSAIAAEPQLMSAPGNPAQSSVPGSDTTVAN